LVVEVVDYHTAGEPFRIVVGGAPDLEGATVLDKRAFVSAHADEVRQLIINEPRGHADQYGCYVTDPDDSGAAFGVIFFHKDGYSTACGHGTIAVATWAAAEGLIPANEGSNPTAIDVPSGRLQVDVKVANGVVEDVTFVNVPSYATARGIEVPTSQGTVSADMIYGGAFYASVDVTEFGLSVTPENVERFISLGREIKSVLHDHAATDHPADARLSGLYGTIFFEHLGSSDDSVHQRNVTIFADGEVDRSPCGSGTSGRLALLYAAGLVDRETTLRHESVTGIEFTARVLDEVEEFGRPAVITEVTGSAYRTGTARFELDPADPLGLGFQLR
jgi:proline racemase